MTATVMIAGKLFRDPQKKISKAEKPYAVAVIRVSQGQGKDASFWNVMAFNDMADQLLACRSGEYITACGTMRAEVYTPAGKDARVSLTVMADQLVTLKKRRQENSETFTTKSDRPSVPFDDSIPF